MEELADVREYDIEHLREHLVSGLLVDMNRLLGHSRLGSLGSGLDFRRRLSVRVDCDARDRIPREEVECLGHHQREADFFL